jgi:2-polyprenyl-6-methoxyphenol hydroxylase-like FAD-dependent oxidoreductase
MISPTPPKGKHGAFLFPIEGDRWIVTMGCGYGLAAPTDEASFMELLRALPAPDVYDVLSHSEPLSEIVSYSFPASRRRRYDKLSRFPEGYLILGDAVASFNPIYGQGMASAALQAGALGKILTRSNLHGAWRSFFRYTAKIIARPWQLAVGEDFRYPETTGHKPIGTNLINRYVERVHRAVHHDRVVYHQFLKVIHLIEPPISLMKPQIAWRVFRAARSK